MDGLEKAQRACAALSAKQGGEIVLLDVRGRSSVTDFLVFCNGSSPPHLKALFGEVQRALKAEQVRCYRKAGQPDAGWLVLDYLDLVIHILLPEAREYYAIESLWTGAPRLPIP